MIEKILFSLLGILALTHTIHAQEYTESGNSFNETMSPASNSEFPNAALAYGDPIDSPYERTNLRDRRVLPYDHIREADVMWEKRLWRVIDVREKLNLPFAYPDKPFITILLDNIRAGNIQAYSALDDKFTTKMSSEDLDQILNTTDTTTTFDPITYEEKILVYTNDFDPTTVKKFRVKESWFFDEETSTMKARILGIAPILEKMDENGFVRFELPIFWVYYPHCRQVLAHEPAYNSHNDVQVMSWEDILEMRMFSSHIVKESNVYDRRVQDYKDGVDMLYESEKIKEGIRNYEHDLWTF